MSWCSCFLFCHPFPYSLGGGISSASEDADLPRNRWVFGKEFITWEISYREFWMRKRWVLYLHDYQPLALNHVLSRILQNHTEPFDCSGCSSASASCFSQAVLWAVASGPSLSCISGQSGRARVDKWMMLDETQHLKKSSWMSKHRSMLRSETSETPWLLVK